MNGGHSQEEKDADRAARDAASGKPHYTGDRIDAASLLGPDDFKDDQARANAMYIAKHAPSELQHLLTGSNADCGRVLAVQDNAIANSWGGVWNYSVADHPPSADVKKIVDDGVAWVAANMHQGHPHHKHP